MSKKNNKGNKKKNNRKNYKIESLEPRLLMDAAPNANDWIKEADAANMNFGEYSISAGSMEMENILIHDSSQTDDEPTSLILTDVTSGSKINFKSEVKAVRNFVKDRVEYLRAKHVEPFKQDWEDKETAYQQLKNSYDHATATERLARPHWLQEIQDADQERQDAENLYYAEYNGFTVDADTLILELVNPTMPNPLKPKPAGCSFSLDTSDSQKHKIKVTIEKLDKPDVPSGKSIAPNIVDDTQIVVNFKDFKKDNSSRKTVVEFFLDADDKTGPADSAGLDVQFDFFQQVSPQNKSANIGILDLESKQDSNENDPDVRVIGSYRVDSNGTQSFESDVKYDLDFNVYNSSLFGAGTKFAADSLDHLKYVGSKQKGTTRWQDASNNAIHDENDFIPNFANVQIGDIVKQFNAVSKWLQNAESTILNNDFKEMIDQNASSFLNLTEYFRSFVKTPPQSLQELLGRLKDKSGQNVITPSFVYDASSNAYVCRLIHIAEYASKSAKATLSESFVHKISETIEDITKVTLNLTQHSKLEVWFDIPMGALENVVATDSLKDIGIDKDNAGGLIGTRPVCVADNLIAKATTVGENVTFTLYDNNVAKGQGVVLAATQLNDSGLQNICGLMSLICGGASFNSIANYDESNNIKNFAFVTDDSTEKLSIGFDTDNSRRMGFNGAQQFCRAYLIPIIPSLSNVTIFGKKIEKGKTSSFDWAAAINEFLMSKSNYADYSAISFKNSVAIVYNSADAVDDIWDNCQGGVAKRMLLSSSMPIVSPSMGVTFDFTVGGTPVASVAITKDELGTCCTVDDVVNVINGKLNKVNNGMTAFAWDGKIGFFNKNDSSFSVTLSNVNLGFTGTSYASTTECMEFVFNDGAKRDVKIDLCNYFKDPSNHFTIEELLAEIVAQCNAELTARGSSCSVAVNGLSLEVSGGVIESVENINGFSLVDLLGWNVENDFPRMRVVRAQKQRTVEISKLDLYVNENLKSNIVNGTVASGRIGPVGVNIKGNIDITAATKISLQQNISDISQITVEWNPSRTISPNYTKYFKCYDDPESADPNAQKNTIGANGPDWTYTSNGSGKNVLTVKHKTGLENGAQSTVCNVDLFDKSIPGKNVLGVFVDDVLLSEEERLFGKKDALNTNRLELSMSAIVDKVAEALKDGVLKNLLKYGDLSKDELDALPNDSVLDVLNQQLPLFGKSAPELLGLVTKLNDTINNITKNHPATLQELNQRIYKALGANIYFKINVDSIDFSFVWNTTYESQRIGINDFAILEGVNVGGAAEVYLSGKIEARFDFSVSTDGTKLGTPELKEGSNVDIDVTLVGKPLSFDLSLNAGGMTPPLMKVVSSDANPSYIVIKIKENLVYEKPAEDVESDEDETDAEESKAIWKLHNDACQIGGKLRVECAGLDVGEIVLGVVGQEYTNDNPTLHVVNCWDGVSGSGSFTMDDVVHGKVGVRVPKFLEGKFDIGQYNTIGSVVLDFSGINTNWDKFDLFGQVRLVADALSAALRKAQSSLNKTFLSDGMRKIPLVGDSIVGAADCLTALDEKFIEPFRKFAYNSQNLDAAMVAERLYTILQKTGLLLALDKKVLFDAQNNCTQKVAWAGSFFDQVFSDNGNQYIQYRDYGNRVEWRFRLGQSYSLSGNADFDLGMPGLGLSSKGGVGLELSWDWYIGFGVSKTGAYIMLSNGSDVDTTDTEDGVKVVADGIGEDIEVPVEGKPGETEKQKLVHGDDIQVKMSVKSDHLGLEGALGFLKMKADVKDRSGKAYGSDPKVRAELATFTFGIDLNDGQNGSTQQSQDDLTDLSADTHISADNVASALSLETNLEGGLDINIVMELGFEADKVDIGFPKIGTTFHLKWNAEFGKPFGSLEEASFGDIKLDLGEFVQRTLKPILGKIQKVIDPIMPLIDFLQSEIPVLSSLPKGGSKMTVLNLIKSIGSAKGLELGMIDDIVKVANLVKGIATFNPSEISLGSLNLFSGLDTADEQVSSFLSGTAGLPLGDFAGRLASGATTAMTTAAQTAATNFSSKFGPSSKYGWFFPIFTNDPSGVFQSLCTSTLQLMFGQDVTLVEYRMSPLIFDFDWSKSFPIVGPLCADIGLNFGAKIELSFGYDTRGLISWKKTGYKDLWALADGFFIDDLDASGKDISEVIFYSGITAGASVAGRAGINVGVNLNLNLNLDDPNNDGKLRLSELADSLAHSPFAIFDASVTLQARAYAYLDLVFYRKEFDLWKSGALELFNTDKKGTGTPIVATTQDGNLVVNVGTFAEKRVYGNLSDGDDTVTITCTGNDVKVKIEGVGDATYKLGSGKTVYVYANEGDDHITVTGNSLLNFVIEGGNGNDQVNLKGLSLGENNFALVKGDSGNDYILGSATDSNEGTNFLFGESPDILYKDNNGREYVALVNAYPNTSDPGNNVIVGGTGKNYIVGGGGHDFIVGGQVVKDINGNVKTDNNLYGDFAYLEFDGAFNLISSKSVDLYDEGGNDVILGSVGKDKIYGGAGQDSIKGGDGDDEIHAGKGNDVVYGGAGNDKIWGDDGVDVIFGDTPVGNMTIAMGFQKETQLENFMTLGGVFPYVYAAEDIKDAESYLYSLLPISVSDFEGNTISENLHVLSLYDFVAKYKTINNVSAVDAANGSFNAAEIDLSAAATQTGTTTPTTPTVLPVVNGSDEIYGGNDSDIIFGDDGSDTSVGGSDIISGGAGNDFIDGDGGNDTISGDYGEDIIYGGAGNDTLDGGAGNDFVFGDNGLADYQKDAAGKIAGSSDLYKDANDENQDPLFGYGIAAFKKNFEIPADAKSSNTAGNDTILAGNGSDFVDGQGGDDTYKIQIMGGSNHAITNVMDSGTADKGDSMTINGTIVADDMLVRASEAGLGFVAKLPSQKDAQIERVNFWNVGGGDTGLENIALNTGAGDDKIAIDGTLSTITIDAGAGDDTVTVGQLFESERTTDKGHSNVKSNDVFKTIKTSQGYLSEGVKHSTSIVGGEGNDTFNVLHNEAAVSLSGGLGNDTFNVAMFQKINDDGSKSIVENGPVTLIGGAGIDKMSIVGSDGDDDFVISQGRVLSNGIDVQAVSIENKNVYGGDGDDSFYVLDTAADEVTKLYGNKGNDSFYNGGVGTAEKPVIVSNSKNENSDAIGVKFDVPKNNTVGDAEPANGVIDYDEDLDCAKNYIDEDGNVKTVYKIHLDKAPKKGETISVTVFAPGETTEALNRGDHGIWLVDGDKYVKSITYRFTLDGADDTIKYDVGAEVKLVVLDDKVREGNDYFALMHKVTSSNTTRLIKDCKNALIFLNEKAAQQSFVIRQVHEVSAAEFTAEKFTLPLNESPIGNTVECFYYANGQKKPLGSANVVENNGKFQVTVDVPASVKTAMDAAKTPYVYVEYNINRLANEVENQFSITQEHVLTAEEVANGAFAWPMQAIPECTDIDCWYMSGDKYVTIPTTALGKYSDGVTTYPNILTVSGVSSIPAGTKLYINYRFDHVYVENESVLQMAYSTTGMTELLCFVPKDEITGAYDNSKYSIVCPESKVADYKDVANCRYFYRTAGTQLIICAKPQNGDTSSAKPVVLHGNFAIEWSGNNEWHRPVVDIADEPDSFNETSVTEILDALDDDTIANIKGALYEDGMGREADLGIDGPSMLHYDGLDKNGNRITTDNDEKNVISESDLAERKAAEEEAAKFDEGNSKDRIFVNNRKNNRAGIKNDIDALSEIAKFDDSMIEKDVDPALILQKTEDVVKQADTEWHDSDEHSLRFEHQDASSTATSQFNLANMEYGEINLGSGADKVDINKTIYREDGFQTFTVVNTGAGKDNINVHSYAREKSTVLGTLSGLTKTTYSGSLKNVIAYSVSGFTFSNGVTSDNLKAIVAQNNDKLDRGLLAQNRVFLNVEYSDGTIQRREVFLEDNDETTVTTLLLKRELTPVAQDVSIVAMYLANGYDGDGLLVVNAQSGNDTIDAKGDEANGRSKVSREGMVVIGGTGNDTIEVNTNVIAFGDRGQIVYENEKGEVVTRLGSLDVDSSVTDNSALDQYDYTTPGSKFSKSETGEDVANTNYFQTDGVVRDAKYIHSVSEKAGGTDTIIANGNRNVVIGGAKTDTIHLNGADNVAVGDNGEVKYVGSDVVNSASGEVVEHVYGDSTKTYLNYVQSTSDEFGDKDTITTGDGKNVVIGGTNADTITTGAGNDVIIGDGGEVYVDRDRNPLFVNNDNRNLPVTELNDEGEEVVKNSSGGDTITANDGDNVVFGGLNGDGAVDKISTGSGKDVVFGDNAYATFRGNSSMASDRKMENLPTVDAQATLSFNFQGASQTGLNPGDEVGATDFKANNWNNISGSIAGTYGNDDAELVRFDNGTRASAVSVSYGGIESHRVTSTDRRINLQSYTLGLHGTSSNKDAKMMNSGLMTTAPNDQCDNQLEVAVDGLAQYFESYQVAVYLDLPDANSWETQSVRKVTLTSGAYSQSFYVNDYAGKNFNGSFVQSHYSSLAMLEADLQYNADLEAQIARGDLDRANAVFKDTSSNYVVFDVPAEFATDRIIVTIEDGIKETNRNGKDIPGIAGIQVKGTFHKQDVAASTDIDYGGNDNIETSGGEDIVVGGTGNDSITTFGDELYGLYDSDVVFGDNAKLTFMDRDNNINTASTLTTAESVAVTNLEASYDDTIDTGDGNDTVVGGIGHDTINAGATAAAEAVRDDVKVLSVNFTSENADESAKIRQATYKIFVPIDDQHQGTVGEDYVLDGAGRKIAIDEHGKKIIETVGETAGVVADNDWHNMYVKNGELHDMEDYSSHYVDGVSVKISTYHKNDRGTWNEYNAGNAAITHENSDELDGDTANSKLYNGYIASQQQYEIKLTLDHIDQFREKNGLANKAKCDLYVYLGGDNNDTDTYNYLYRISLNNDEVHYLNDWTGHKFDGDYRDATRHPAMALVYGIGVVGDSGVRVELVGNYIVFRDFTGDRASIRILNEYTGGGQSPKNLPVISAVQIVAGEGRQDPRLAIGGDHDKDLVYGDDAKLTFDLDIPFAEDEVLTDYQNRVTEAKSIAIDQAAVTKISTEDTITTGKDRDVVVGGEGKDTITMGDGDDVAVGGSANLIVEHNNPLGVFTPNTEIALDQHTINLNLHQNYLDNDNANEQSFQTRLEQGYIAGVQEVDNTNDRKNEISLGKGRNLHLDGSTNQSALVVEEQQQSTDPGTTPGTDPGTTPGNDQPGNDQPGNDQPGTQQGDTLPTALAHDGNSVQLSFNQAAMVNVRAGQTIRLVAYNWDGINSWHPNLVLRANPCNGQFPLMTFNWQGCEQPQTYPSKPGEEWFFEVNIPDAYNEVDEQGRKCLAVYVTATADTTFMLTLGSSGN